MNDKTSDTAKLIIFITTIAGITLLIALTGIGVTPFYISGEEEIEHKDDILNWITRGMHIIFVLLSIVYYMAQRGKKRDD